MAQEVKVLAWETESDSWNTSKTALKQVKSQMWWAASVIPHPDCKMGGGAEEWAGSSLHS